MDSSDAASYPLFNRISPGAVLSSALLHATLVAAFLPTLPQIDRHLPGRAIEFTVDLPTAPPAAPPRRPTLEQVLPPVETAPPLATSELAAIAPPPSPTLEQVLPPLEAPPPPLAAPELAAIAPPSAPKPAEPKPAVVEPAARAPAPPAPLRQTVAAAAAREHGPNLSRGAVRAAPAQPSSEAASDERRREAREDYLREVIARLSQFRFSRSSAETSEQGLVVARLTVARDGRLLQAALARSSGFPDLDSGVMETIRRAAPFAPLPPDIAQDRYTFIVPINYVRDR